MSRLSITSLNRLGVLSREIRRDYESLQKLVERTRRNCNEVIAETILLGNKLTEAKRLVGHGNWEEWLAKNCSEVSANTARNYMRLAKAQHVVDLNSHKSLRKAYLYVGIIPTEEEIKSAPVVEVSQPSPQIEPPPSDAPPPVLEAAVVEAPVPVNEQPAIAATQPPQETPVAFAKDKVNELMDYLKTLDLAWRKKVAVHLKPVVIYYHRFGK